LGEVTRRPMEADIGQSYVITRLRLL